MSPRHRISERVFGALATMVVRAPWLVVAVSVLLAAAGAMYAWFKLEMKTDQNDLVSSNLPYNQRYMNYLEEFGDLEFLYVVILVEGEPRRAMQVADAVAAEVSKLGEHVESVLHRIPPDSFGDSRLLLASRAEIEEIARSVEGGAGLLKRLEKVDRFSRLLQFFGESLASGLEDQGTALARWGFQGLDFVLGSLMTAARGESPPTLESLFAEGADDADPLRSGYLFSSNLKLAFVEIMPRKDFKTLEVIHEPLNEIRKALERVRARFPGAKLGLTGRPVLSADEMKTTNEDMTYSTVLAFAGVLALFVLFFKRLRRPLLAGLTLCIALAIAFGVVTLTLGYLTLLSIVFAVMLVGLGVDFGVILVARYQEEILASDDIDGSLRRTLLSTGMGIWTGALTTGCAFYSSTFVDFKGLQELGFVAGTGLLVCLVCMLTLLPALIVITDHHIRKRRVLHPPHPLTVPILQHAARHPRGTLIIFGLLTAVGLLGFQGIPYSANLLDLQAKGLESVEYERKIEELSDRSTWQAVFIADTLEAVDRTVAGLRPAQEAGIIGVVESVRDFLPADQLQKMERLKGARDILRSLKLPPPATDVDAKELRTSLAGLLDGLFHLQSLAASRGSKDDAEAVKSLEGLIEKAEGLEAALEKDPAVAVAGLAAYQRRWGAEVEALRSRFERLLGPPPITLESLHPELRRRLVSRDGEHFAVYAYPQKDIWQEKNMQEFVEAARKVDPMVTGVSVQVHESARLMYEGFLRAALYSLLMVFGFLLIDFRSLRDALITMVPVLIGVLWALELMPLLGLTFNLANFFSLPIVIGCGVDAGVHMFHRFRETGSTAEVGLTTGSAVTLANLSNMIGFASMGIARHRGVASLGMVTALGCLTVLIASVVLLPCFLEVFKKTLLRSRARKTPGKVLEGESR